MIITTCLARPAGLLTTSAALRRVRVPYKDTEIDFAITKELHSM